MQLIPTDNPSISKLVHGDVPPIAVIGNEAIRKTFDEKTLQQAINARGGAGVADDSNRRHLVVNEFGNRRIVGGN